MKEATRVCGQFVHIIMKPDEANRIPATTPAPRLTPRRPRKATIPPMATTNSPSLTKAGANHSGSTKYGSESGLNAAWFGSEARGAPPTS